tara:strand:+ start:723 stop:1655 length:933 start_codon:yes stop_codon:yes gene_type:complete
MEIIKTENNVPVVKLPNKPKKILLCMLTHHNLPALKRMVKSVEQQHKEENLIIEPVIVVNTLTDQYYEDVLNEGFSFKVIRTESNGKPGKGKNSCRDLFLKSNADYLTQVDGDDFLYPTFVKSIWEHIEWYPCIDVLGKHPLDAVANEKLGGHHFTVGKNDEYWGCVWGDSMFKRTDHGPGQANWVTEDHPSSFDRILLQSRKSAKIRMDEDIPNGEDHLYSMQLLALHQQRKLSYFVTMSSDLYVTVRTETDTIQFQFPFPPHVENMKTKMREHVQEWRSSQEELPMVFKPLLLDWEQKRDVIRKLYAE